MATKWLLAVPAAAVLGVGLGVGTDEFAARKRYGDYLTALSG